MRSKLATSEKKAVTIVWIIKTPLRALCKAKDVYVKCISSFSNTYNRPVMIMEDANRTTIQLPRSFSSSTICMLSSNDHMNQQPGELMRANSTHISMADIERYMMIQNQNQQLQLQQRNKGVPRSCSVGMGKIDEDRVSSFRDDCILFKNKVVVKVKDSRLSTNCS